MALEERSGCWHGLHVVESEDGDLELTVDDREEWAAYIEEQVWAYSKPPLPARAELEEWLRIAHQRNTYEALERELPWARIGVLRMAPDLVAYFYPEILDNLS